jgi:cell division protein FtsZ
MSTGVPPDHPAFHQHDDGVNRAPDGATESSPVIDLFPAQSQPSGADAPGSAARSAEDDAVEAGWRDAPETPDEPTTQQPAPAIAQHEVAASEAAGSPAATSPGEAPQASEAPEDAANGAARLMVVGVGGAGCNIVNHMIESGMGGVEFVAINTDTQALSRSQAARRLAIGVGLTRGMGTGGNPAIGQQAAQESYHDLVSALNGADMVFITAGMGGGTGTGSSPIVAQAAREVGALTLAIVTTPFAFERRRRTLAEQGVAALRSLVDALITVPNERLAQLVGRDTSIFDAYRQADEALRMGVQGLSDLITIPGLVNLDFADVRSVMSEAGSAYLANGTASGEGRAENALRSALSNPLLDVDITGARGLIFNVTGGDTLSMREVEQIANALSAAVHPDANLIFGATYDPAAGDALKVTVVATGFEPHVAPEARPSTWTPGRIPLAPGRSEGRPEPSVAGPPSRAPESPVPGRMVFDEPLPHLSQPPGADYGWSGAPPPWAQQYQSSAGAGRQAGVTVNPINPAPPNQPPSQPPNQPPSQPPGQPPGQQMSQAPSQPAGQPPASPPPTAPGRPQGGADQIVRPAYPREDYAVNTEETGRPAEREDRHGFWSRLFSSSPSNVDHSDNPPDAPRP